MINRLRLIERGRRPLREYADEYDFERKDTQMPDYSLVEIFLKQVPERVGVTRVEHMPGYLSKPFKEVRNWCVDYDTTIRNNLFLARSTTRDDREKWILAQKIAQLKRQNAEI